MSADTIIIAAAVLGSACYLAVIFRGGDKNAGCAGCPGCTGCTGSDESAGCAACANCSCTPTPQDTEDNITAPAAINEL